MMLALMIIVATAGGPGDAPSGPDGRAADRPAVRSAGPMSGRLAWIAPRSDQGPCRLPWSWTGLDEFDAEEFDETWMVDLGLMASIPASWLCVGSTRSRPSLLSIEAPDLARTGHFPLRC